MGELYRARDALGLRGFSLSGILLGDGDVLCGPNLDSSKDVIRCSTPASLEKTQGSERVN
jgi:hypothetical protein